MIMNIWSFASVAVICATALIAYALFTISQAPEGEDEAAQEDGSR